MDQEVMDELKEAIAQLLEKEEIHDALPMMKQAANWGDLESQKQLIDIFLHGKYGIVFDPKNGFAYARLAAMNGDAQAMYEFARLNKEGIGCAKNMEQAFYFMNKAAAARYPFAYDELAVMYVMGQGCQKDIEQARFWNLKALEQLGHTPEIDKHARMIKKALEKA